MLAQIVVSAGRPFTAVDIGCGDGICTKVALTVCGRHPERLGVASSPWTGRGRPQAGEGHGVPVARASADDGGLPLADSTWTSSS